MSCKMLYIGSFVSRPKHLPACCALVPCFISHSIPVGPCHWDVKYATLFEENLLYVVLVVNLAFEYILTFPAVKYLCSPLQMKLAMMGFVC